MNTIKMWVENNLLISALIIFVVLYIFFHYDKLSSNQCFMGDYQKTLLWTAVILLVIVISSMFMNNENVMTTGGYKKYKIVNELNNNLDDIFVRPS